MVGQHTGATIVPGPRGTLPDVIPEPANDGTPAPSTGSPADVPADDDAVLDQLEADLTAVEHAISTLDRVTAEGEGGESAANQISVAVSDARFGVESADEDSADERSTPDHSAAPTA